MPSNLGRDISDYWAACELLRQHVHSAADDNHTLTVLERRVEGLEAAILKVIPSSRDELLQKSEFIGRLVQECSDAPSEAERLISQLQNDIASFLDRTT